MGLGDANPNRGGVPLPLRLSVGSNLIGGAALEKVAMELPQVLLAALEPVLREISKMVAAEAKARVRSKSGLLVASIGTSPVRRYRNSGSRTIYIAVGPRRGFRRVVTQAKRGGIKKLGKGRSAAIEAAAGGWKAAGIQNPVKYAHLVEGGRGPSVARPGGILYSHSLRRGFGTSVAAAPPHPFMAPAEAAGMAAMSLIENKVAEVMARF